MKKTQTAVVKSNRSSLDAQQTQSVLNRIEVVKREMANVEMILGYEDYADIGIGYRRDTGKLIEYKIPHPRFGLETGDSEIEVSEITLTESVEWAEKMQFAETRFDECTQLGNGFPRWLREIREVLMFAE